MAADIDSIIDGLMGDIVGKPDGGEIPVDGLQNTIQNICLLYTKEQTEICS